MSYLDTIEYIVRSFDLLLFDLTIFLFSTLIFFCYSMRYGTTCFIGSLLLVGWCVTLMLGIEDSDLDTLLSPICVLFQTLGLSSFLFGVIFGIARFKKSIQTKRITIHELETSALEYYCNCVVCPSLLFICIYLFGISCSMLDYYFHHQMSSLMMIWEYGKQTLSYLGLSVSMIVMCISLIHLLFINNDYTIRKILLKKKTHEERREELMNEKDSASTLFDFSATSTFISSFMSKEKLITEFKRFHPIEFLLFFIIFIALISESVCLTVSLIDEIFFPHYGLFFVKIPLDAITTSCFLLPIFYLGYHRIIQIYEALKRKRKRSKEKKKQQQEEEEEDFVYSMDVRGEEDDEEEEVGRKDSSIDDFFIESSLNF